MNAMPLAIPDLIEITPTLLADHRGHFGEIFRERWFRETIAPVSFVQENQSFNLRAGTIRGLHLQLAPFAQGKLVRCLTGAAFDVAVDVRPASPSFGQWAAVLLSPERANQLWIPPGFLHGFCTLRPQTVISYKVTAYYDRRHERGVAWNDPDIAIAWPAVADANLLSERDRTQPSLEALQAEVTKTEVDRCA